MSTVKRSILILILLSLLLGAPTVQAQDVDNRVAQIMARMSVEDKVGQLFLVPFVGSDVNPGSDIWQLLTEYKVGGVILLNANSNFNNDESAPRQIAELTNSLKTTAFNTNGLPLFIAIDYEGDGYPYTRVTGGMTPIPSQMALGATWNPANAAAVGQIVGQELSALGVNLLLGPGLDVLNVPKPTGQGDIGTRVFGGDPYWVGQMGRAYIRGLRQGSQGKIATVAKHFPGHGGSDRLPDNEIATVDKSLQELGRIELPPFFHVTASLSDDPAGQTDALMSSHIRYRGFQGDIRQFTAPISFDANGMNTLLNLPEIAPWREQGGLIVSDALGVPAVRKYFDPTLTTFPHRRIAKEAFLAGNDILSLDQFALKSVWSDEFANIKDAIYFFRTEYQRNPAFAGQVDQAVARILRLKLKLYPNLTAADLNIDPHQAQQAAGHSQAVINDIARQSLTLLYPSPAELRLRIPQSPRPGESILIIIDDRLTRECFTDNCPPKEVFWPRAALQDAILRLYGPSATGQIQPEQISTITFSELKLALAGTIAPPAESPLANEPNPLIQVSADEVRRRLQAAKWLIFAALDLNTVRYPDSDALKLFLAQESGALLDKTTLVLAFNAPYYLDTTEVTKLTAYYGVYSKIPPYLEAAVRALFGETDLPGASPVTVEGIGYKLVDVLAPNPAQKLAFEPLDISPPTGDPPVTVKIRVGPVLDYNGHSVPDDTPVEVKGMIGERQIAAQTGSTKGGLAEITLTLTEPGDIEVLVVAGQAASAQSLQVKVTTPPTVTPPPTVAAAPTDTPTALPATAAPAPTSSPTPLPVPLTPANTGSLTPNLPSGQLRRVDGLDLLSALGATLLAGLLGFWLGQQFRQPLSRRVKLGLWVLIGGLTAYLLYAGDWLRPEQWFTAQPDLTAGRLAIAGLAFGFSLVMTGLFSGHRRATTDR